MEHGRAARTGTGEVHIVRVELRVEDNEHEYVITVECDQSVQPGRALSVALSAMNSLTRQSVNDAMFAPYEPLPKKGQP